MVQTDKEIMEWSLIIDDRLDAYQCSDEERDENERIAQEVIAARKDKRLMSR